MTDSVETAPSPRPEVATAAATGAAVTGGGAARAARHPLARALSFRTISALYIFVVLFVVFSIWIPGTFLEMSTWKALFDNGAITSLAAIGLILPVAAGAFDLALGTEVGMGAIFVAWLLGKQGLSPALALPLAIVVGAAIGCGSGVLITRFRVDSFIATLGDELGADGIDLVGVGRHRDPRSQ